MTDRPRPVGSGGGAEAILVGMAVQVSHDDVIGDVAGGGGEVAPAPEALAPVALADVFELLLDFARLPAFCVVHEVSDRDMRRDFDEHVDVIARQRAVDDRHAYLAAYLLAVVADPDPDLAMEHIEPVLERPGEMVAMMRCCVATG